MSGLVKRISHATFETTDVDRLTDYYVNVVGLSLVGKADGRSFLAAPSGLQALVIEKGAAPRAKGLAFQISRTADLSEVARTLKEQHGIAADIKSDAVPGIAQMLSFKDNNGTDIDLLTEFSFLDVDKTTKPIMPPKLGHLAMMTPAIQESATFYGEVLGFRISDWREDFFVWMRCGPDHHTANFARGETVKMHHYAYQLKEAVDILRACDHLAASGFPVIYGPGRHLIGDNIFIYHRNPDGQIVEFYAELAQMDSDDVGFYAPRPGRDDRPYEPHVWGAVPGNYWGPGAPPGFRDG